MALHVYEFEIFESEGWFCVIPFDMLGGTQGEDFREACEMAADWLRIEMEEREMHGEEPPTPTFGNEPSHGGRVVVVAVEVSLDNVPAVPSSEAAGLLGMSNARVLRLCRDGVLGSWRSGRTRMVALESIRYVLAMERCGRLDEIVGA